MAETEDEIPPPPAARKIARLSTAHGETLADDYYWMREKTSQEVIGYLEAENAYAEAVMRPTEALQAELYREMLARIKQTDENVPYREGEYFYYSRTEEGKQYPIYARRRGSAEAPEEVVLDLNELAEGLQFLSVGSYSVTDDGRLLAYTLDTTGFREYTLFVKDLRTGEALGGARERVSSAAWAADNRTLFFVTDDEAKRPHRLFRTAAGAPADEDVLLYEEADRLFRLEVGRTRSRAFVLAASASFTATEYRYLPAGDAAGEFCLVLPRERDHEYYVDHHGGEFYLRTNEGGAKNFRLVAAPAADPRRENWREVIPHRKDVMLEDVDFFASFFVAHEREDGLPKMRVETFGGGGAHYLEFPEAAYSAHAGENRVYDTAVFRFHYESFTTPASVYDYDTRTRERRLLKQTPVLGGYDPSLYQSERVRAAAPDGALVPVSLVYKKELRRDGSRPALLYGYGAYGLPLPVKFNSARLSLLDRGLVYAVAHVRGGGDLGKEWHEAGRLTRKQNTFTDFVAAAEHLVREKYTSSDRLVITGGSAGGLLMGAVVNMRPDLFRAVVSQVPFVDVVNTMLDASLPLTVGEYEEWGNPNEREAYEYIKSYSPYDNVAARDYPAMLVKTGLHDSQVMYWEPAKYVARLRAAKTDKNVLLFKTNMGAGHGGSSGRYDSLREVAFDYAFILTQLGITS